MLAEIVAHPDDDAPRLVYADHLIACGDPRGELIALSCRNEQQRDPALERRIAKLISSHREQWCGELVELMPDGGFEFRRGFVEHLEGVDGRSYRPVAEALQLRAPLLRSFEVEYGTRDVVAASPMLHRLQPRDITPGDMRALAKAPGARGLRELVLVKEAPSTTTMCALAELPQPIEVLSLGFDGRLAAFARSPVIDRLAAREHVRVLEIRHLRHLDGQRSLATILDLERLVLDNADLAASDIVALAAGLVSLVALDVSNNYSRSQADDLDAEALLEVASPSLRELRLNKLGLGDRQAIAIACSPRASALTQLDLGRNQIGDDGALAIARSEHLGNLTALNLNANSIGDDAKQALRIRFAAAKLQLR